MSHVIALMVTLLMVTLTHANVEVASYGMDSSTGLTTETESKRSKSSDSLRLPPDQTPPNISNAVAKDLAVFSLEMKLSAGASGSRTICLRIALKMERTVSAMEKSLFMPRSGDKILKAKKLNIP